MNQIKVPNPQIKRLLSYSRGLMKKMGSFLDLKGANFCFKTPDLSSDIHHTKLIVSGKTSIEPRILAIVGFTVVKCDLRGLLKAATQSSVPEDEH